VDLVEHNPFAALPYIIDGDTVVATAPASSGYLAHKLCLEGSDEAARSRNQQALAVVYELRADALRVLYAPAEVYEMGHRGHLERTVRMHYSKLNCWLEMHGTKYLTADSPASADFELWEMLDMHELWANDSGVKRPLAPFQHLTKLYERVRLLPALQPYFLSPAFHLPFNNKMARFRQTDSSKHDALCARKARTLLPEKGAESCAQKENVYGTINCLYMVSPPSAWRGKPSHPDERSDFPLPPP
jgi:hypothetical protein